MPRWTKTAKERFEEKTMPEPNSGCLLWLGCLDPLGRAYFYFGGPTLPAARVSWTLYRGSIPRSLHVLHKCDNPACVEPSHLYLGTAKENSLDRSRRGRVPYAKLSPDTVREARALVSQGHSYPSVAKRFGVGTSTLFEAVNRKTWAHVA